MPEHTTGTREEWLAARKELLQREKEHSRQGDEISRIRERLPWVPVEKEYRFETDEGTRTLAALFAGRSQLLVYHFMFGVGLRVEDEAEGCTGCSFVADHFDAVLPHLGGHDVTLVCSSMAPLERLQAYKRRMGWEFPWFPRWEATSTMTSGSPFPTSNGATARSTTSSAWTMWARSARG